MSEIIHDIDTMIDYVDANWRTTGSSTRIKPDSIYRNGQVDDNGKVKPFKKWWMFKNCIEVSEDDTIYKLLDMRGNADALNDTDMGVFVCSKVGEDVVLEMFAEFIYWIRELARQDDIGHYAFSQITSSKPIRSRFYTMMSANILLTRRGKGHEQ